MLLPNNSYHIYNHANGPENLFVDEKNYPYFLKQYQKYISPIAYTYAYCLMPNHFHLLIRIKTEEELLFYFSNYKNEDNLKYQDRQGFLNLDGLDINNILNKQISHIFSNFFNSYSKAFNKMYKRRGALFLRNFKRKMITSENQFISTLLYIHLNPIKHGFTNNISDWKYNSYSDYNASEPTGMIQTEDILSRFNSLADFNLLHENKRKQILSMHGLE